MAWSSPDSHVYATGEIVTAATLNTYVRSNLDFLYGDTSWTAVGTFTNSWANFGAPYFNAAYRLVGTRVYLRGMIKSGTLGTSAFTLPTGYRPTASVRILSDGSGGASPTIVGSDGTVTVSPANNSYTSLDSITFDTI